MRSLGDGRRAGGALAQALITACVTGIVTSLTMVGPLLLDISRDLGISVAQAGLLAAAAAVPQALGSPFSGLLSDRLGRRPMIVFSLGSVGVLGFATALAPSFAACAIRFAAGPSSARWRRPASWPPWAICSRRAAARAPWGV
jgi:predicted MFS family arabinose efflux permease